MIRLCAVLHEVLRPSAVTSADNVGHPEFCSGIVLVVEVVS